MENKLAIICHPDHFMTYAGLAIRAGYYPVNSITGLIMESDIQLADFVFYPIGWKNDPYLFQLVRFSMQRYKASISILNLKTSQKTVFSNTKSYSVSYLTHCPGCFHQDVAEGVISISDDDKKVKFYNFSCPKCKLPFTPIHFINDVMA